MLWNAGVRTALISDVPYLRDPSYGFARGFDDVAWVRGSGYDPVVPAGDPRAVAVRIEDEPGLRLPPEDDPDRDLWVGRWEQLLRNRAALGLHAGGEHRRPRGPSMPRSTGSTAGAEAPPPSCSGSTCSPRTAPGTCPAPYRDLYAAAEPDEFEMGEEGDLAEDEEEDENLDLEEIPALIDVPAGAVGDVLDEAELLRLRRTYAGAVTLLDAQLGRLFDALRQSGRLDDTLVVFTADQGEPLGEHGYVRRFRPWLYEELIHTPLIVRLPGGEHGGDRHQAIVQTVDLLADGPRGPGPAPRRDRPRPRPAPPDPRRADEAPRLRLPGHGRRGVRHPHPPLAPDRPGRGRPRRPAPPPRALPQARGPLGRRTTSPTSTPRSPTTSN